MEKLLMIIKELKQIEYVELLPFHRLEGNIPVWIWKIWQKDMSRHGMI